MAEETRGGEAGLKQNDKTESPFKLCGHKVPNSPGKNVDLLRQKVARKAAAKKEEAEERRRRRDGSLLLLLWQFVIVIVIVMEEE